MTFRTLIIPSAHVQLARDLAAAIDPAGSQGLFMTPLTNGNQITHYISTGIVSDNFAQPLPCTQWAQDEQGAWVQTSHWPGMPEAPLEAAQVAAAFAASDISEQEPFVAMGRMGLSLHSVEEP